MSSASNTPVVLINPPPEKFVEEYDTPAYGHLGLAYLGSALRQSGIGCAILDAKLGRLTYEEVVGSAVRIAPKVVGITSFTHEIRIAATVAGEIKRRLPGVKVVIGGVHASSLPTQTLKDFPCYDFLIKGEGEYSFVTLCEMIIAGRQDRISEIPGVAFRKNGDIVVVQQGAWIKDLDRLDFPAWDLFPKMTAFQVLTSRGCPYQCVFCARMLGEQMRLRSPENVVAELEILTEKFGARNVTFCDETFGFYREWLERLTSLLIEKGLNKKVRWAVATRAQLVNEEMLRRMKAAGCVRVDFGVESGDDRILKVIKKGETKEDFLRAARLIKRAGIESHSYFILGHPHETKETAMNTVNFAAALNTDYVAIGIMIPYPGTEVARLASRGEGGYKKISADWADYNKQLGNALELESISRAELTKLQLSGYLKFYAKNFKIALFLIAAWKYRRLIAAILIKYIKASMSERKDMKR